MKRLSALVALSLSVPAVVAKSCISFDSSFNLLAFGFGTKDYNAGTQDQWSSNPSDITTSGRPPFDGSSTVCYLSWFQNAVYVIGGDSKNPNSMYIFDVTSKSWTMQNTNPGQLDYKSYVAVLDHDTNVFYAMSNGEMFSLDMGDQKAANGGAVEWVDAKKATFNTANYRPVMGLANNHIHFLDVPGLTDGNVNIFVIHFSLFSPEPQTYPVTGGGSIPAQHGQTASINLPFTVQNEFAYIPDDGSATYVINSVTNSTQKLAGPTSKDSSAVYFASETAIVQLDSKGTVSYLPYNPNNTDSNKIASWSKINNLSSLYASPPSSSSSSSGTTKGSETVVSGSKPTSSSGGQIKNSAVSLSSVSSAIVLLLSLGFVATL